MKTKQRLVKAKCSNYCSAYGSKEVRNSRTQLWFDPLPSGDIFHSVQQNLAQLHSLTAISPVMLSVYLYSASKWLEQDLKHGINKLKCLNRATSGCEVLWAGEWQLGGDIWDDFLIVEKHPLPHIGSGDSFYRWGGSSSLFTKESERRHHNHSPPPLPDFTLLLASLEFEHKPDHLRSPSRIVHCCVATDPSLLRLHWDIWPSSNCHLFCGGFVHQTGIPDMPICWLH